jgi:two-component system, OmpR family, sensor histidine kinase BaeS
MPDQARGPIGLRLALAFVAVAILAVALVAGLAVVFSEKDISTLEQQRRSDLINALIVDAASTYNTGKPGWFDVDLKPALALAASSGTDVTVLDQGGHVVASTIKDPTTADGLVARPITLGETRIGTLLVKFSGRGLVASIDHLRTAVAGAVIGAAGLAALLALIVAVIISRRITRPVTRLIDTARAMASGDRQSRVGAIPGAPTELAELAATFDTMAETLAAQEQLRRDLVADVAHELRTPVAVLQANCEALLDGVVPHSREQTASLHEEVLRLARIVDDLQTLAAAKAAALQLDIQPFDLAQIASDAADAWETSFAAAGLALTRQLRPAPIDADPGRIHQIIDNLLNNALKFTPAGGRVAITLRCLNGNACLQISDTGIGIAKADQPHLFERLWRGTNAEQTTGTGIGLAVATELTQAHRGTIEVCSEPDHGSEFTLVLPLAKQ